MELTNVEKARVLMKIEWEGGLLSYMDYGLSSRLYKLFEEEFDTIYKFKDKKRFTKKQCSYFNIFEKKLNDYLETTEKFTDDELNNVAYILDVN